MTPATLANVPAGSHSVRLTLAGYQDWTDTVRVSAGQTTTVSANLQATPEPTGSISVTSTPPGAAIWLDNLDQERLTPAVLEDVPVGPHTLHLVLVGYAPLEDTVEVVPGQQTDVSYQLANSPPQAAVAVDPLDGVIDQVFTFDASASTDAEEPLAALEFRWDWENDGTWDADWGSGPTATHSFSAPGNYTVACEVRDTPGLTGSAEVTVVVRDPGNVEVIIE